MTVIDDKHNCCGCSSCVQACPQSCISLQADQEGFLYPATDTARCISCNICEKVCPMTGHVVNRLPEQSYVTYSTKDSVRNCGSSGGMFQTIAEYVVRTGGIVFGARFDEQWNVVHDCSDNIEGIKAFCGSKYMQSRIGQCFRQAKAFLEEGREVLFTGTPCQIHGLKKYLRKEYDNLLTIDFVCHGVPSPAVWQSYLEYTAANSNVAKEQVSSVSFRDKRTGWKQYSLTIGNNGRIISSKTFRKDSYMQLFLHDLTLRPSCYSCRFKNGTNVSDITLGDFWGVTDICPEIDDDCGLSITLANSSKGCRIISELDSAIVRPMTFQECIHKNPSFVRPAQESPDRDSFWNCFRQKGYAGAASFLKSIQPSRFSRLKYGIKIFVRKLLHLNTV